jgi:hypothetical protein
MSLQRRVVRKEGKWNEMEEAFSVSLRPEEVLPCLQADVKLAGEAKTASEHGGLAYDSESRGG